MSALAITASVMELLSLLAQAEQAREQAKEQADSQAAQAQEQSLWEQIKKQRAAVEAVLGHGAEGGP